MVNNWHTERNISWIVKTQPENLMQIIVKNNDTDTIKTEEYQLCWTPIFGYDAKDIEIINEILDKLIEEVK